VIIILLGLEQGLCRIKKEHRTYFGSFTIILRLPSRPCMNQQKTSFTDEQPEPCLALPAGYAVTVVVL
jgi:hypothetical protein